MFNATLMCFSPLPGRSGGIRIMLADKGEELKDVMVGDDWATGPLKAECVSKPVSLLPCR